MLDGMLTFLSSTSDEAAGQTDVQVGGIGTLLGLAHLCADHFDLKSQISSGLARNLKIMNAVIGERVRNGSIMWTR